MKIYLDLLLIINFFFDFIIIYGTKYILKITTKLYRIILGSLFGSLTIILLFLPLNSLLLFVYKILISIFIILISFGKRNFFKNLLYFYLISIILGGSLYLLDITYVYDNTGLVFFSNGLSINFLFIIIASPIIIYLYIKENKSYKNMYSNIYNTKIIINNNTYLLKSILDTANNLKDPYSSKNIILVNSNINIYKEKFLYVPYKALNTNGIIKCFKPNKVIINNKEFKNCLIGVSKDKFCLGDIDCILPSYFKEDL
ncbi:MAG: sigma-E processing peptidase SpoIIGA [Bacilli bacterium]|nr:sigma-E processing peptidase SpoIIGA [Bacilli bacterium]